MPLGILFWAVFILIGCFGGFWLYYDGQPLWGRRFSGYIVLLILVGILGYRVFGSAVK
jgi:hypothetical protein